MTNDQTTAGPATGTAWDRTKKMPVPIVAPMPIIESWNSPIERASSPSGGVGAGLGGHRGDRLAPQELLHHRLHPTPSPDLA